MLGSIPAFFHITPKAAYIASGQSNKKGSFTLVKTFPLQGIKGFHYWKFSS
jgi:hypothetical protein